MSGDASPAALLLELHCAANAFLTRRTVKDAAGRDRLRRAILALMREGGMIAPADLLATEAEALAGLRQIVARLKALRADWSDVVAIVNREPAEAA